MAITNPELEKINTTTRGCMDGREVLLRLLLHGHETVEMVSDREAAKHVVEAKLPGADLGFVALLQDKKVMSGKVMSDEDAFTFVTQTLTELNLTPQFHVDDHHGEIEIPKDKEQLKELANTLEAGCGFAGLIWGDRAGQIIALAKKHGWMMEILTGGHHEAKAVIMTTTGKAINNHVAIGNHRAAFSFNEREIKTILEAMEKKLGNEGFSERGMTWFLTQFAFIANKISEGKITRLSGLS